MVRAARPFAWVQQQRDARRVWQRMWDRKQSPAGGRSLSHGSFHGTAAKARRRSLVRKGMAGGIRPKSSSIMAPSKTRNKVPSGRAEPHLQHGSRFLGLYQAADHRAWVAIIESESWHIHLFWFR